MIDRTRVVGNSVTKPDATAKVRGEARYAADIQRPNAAYGIIVRSPQAAAVIKTIDVAEATGYPGVCVVLTAQDIPGEKLVGARTVRDQPVFAESIINFAGEAVALVLAESAEVAAEAARRVHVVYEPLEPITDPAKALLTESRKLRPQGNLCHELNIVRGDFNAACERAAFIVKNTYRTQFVDHGYIEPDAVVAEPDGDGVALWVTSKSPHHDQEEVARVLALPRDKVRVAVASIGGSFGGKPDLPMLSMAALGALKLQRPIKIVLDRDECLSAKTKRHPYWMEYTHAVAATGEILGVRVDIIADAGAYSSYTPTATSKGLIHAAGPYRVPNVDMRIRAAFTNNPITGAMRGYGVPQVVFAVERQMDIIARRLGMDPLELRIKNAVRSGDTTATGQKLDDVRLVECLEEAKRLSGSLRLRGDATGLKAWGIAAFFYGVGRTGVADKARVATRLEPDGLVHVFAGTPDTGQGSDTALAQIAAQELGLPFELVRLTSGDTRSTFDSGTSTASRVTYIVGNAVQRSAAEFKSMLLDVASEMEGCRVSRLTASQDYLRGLAYFCTERNIRMEGIGHFQTSTSELDMRGQGEPYGAYSYGVQFSHVTVDPETGKVDVDHSVCCYDAGTVVNPALFQAQIEGGTIMAQGYALTEELVLQDAAPRFPNFHAYLLPTALDASPISVSNVESFEQTGPFGAKGVGEPTTLPGAAAIANAVCAALGKEFYELPLTTEKISWAGCADT